MSWSLSQCVLAIYTRDSCVCVSCCCAMCNGCIAIKFPVYTTPAGLVPRQTKEHSLVVPTLELCKVTRICTTAQIFSPTDHTRCVPETQDLSAARRGQTDSEGGQRADFRHGILWLLSRGQEDPVSQSRIQHNPQIEPRQHRAATCADGG